MKEKKINLGNCVFLDEKIKDVKAKWAAH